MPDTTIATVGLFSSDPWSRRALSLEHAFRKLGVDALHVLPWKISRVGSKEGHLIQMDGHALDDLDLMIVLDLGGHDIGTFFSRVGILSALQEQGVDLVNPVNPILQMRNKAECIRKLISARLPVPKTLITESIEKAAGFIKENVPCVLKPLTGFGGTGVQLVEREFDLKHIYDYLKFHSQQFGKGAYLLQEYIEGPGFDIRALVLEGKVISSMQRIGQNGIVTNVHAGGIPRSNDLDVMDLALKAAKSVKGRLVGVDIIPDSQGDMYVLEVNATPGWAGLQRVTPFDISERIASVLASR